MPVISCNEEWAARTASVDDQGVRYLKRAWVIETDDKLLGPDQVADEAIADWDFPKLYDQHPTYTLSRARSLSVEPLGGPMTWIATWNYSSAPFPAQPVGLDAFVNGVGGGSPVTPSENRNKSTPAQSRPPQFSLNYKFIRKAAEKDRDGLAFLNSAKDPFENIEIDYCVPVVTIKYWSLNVSFAHAISYVNTVNNEEYLGCLPDTLLCSDYQISPIYDNIGDGVQALIWECTITLEYKRDYWTLEVLDTGKRKLLPNGDIVVITDMFAQPITEPVPLKNGVPLTPGPGVEVDYQAFNLYPYADFSALMV